MRKVRLLVFVCGFLAVGIFLHTPQVARAQEVQFVAPDRADDYIEIVTPERQTAFFGTLTGYPHTYLVEGTSGLQLSLQIAEPDVMSARRSMTGIVVTVEDPGVAEVARINRVKSSWESIRFVYSGDSYWLGPELTEELENKTYLIEVSNPENTGRYVLFVGVDPAPPATGFWGRLGVIRDIKAWAGKPWWTVFVSPYYYVPTVIIVGFALWYGYRRRIFGWQK